MGKFGALSAGGRWTRLPAVLRPELSIPRLVSSLIILLVLAWVRPQPGSLPPEASAAAAGASDAAPLPSGEFEALAAVVGRAGAWQQTYGAATEFPAPTSIPAPADSDLLTQTTYLPLVARVEPASMVERRAIWITRYDWTNLNAAPSPETIDALVNQVAGAGFNTIFFQVRAAGDAYYASELEPWAARLSAGPISETLGHDPGWDPLARMVEVGQAAGLEVHAYVNVYPAWLPPPEGHGDLWPPATTPPQMFDRFTYGPTYAAHPGEYAMGYEWRQHLYGVLQPTPMPLTRNRYLWASPGVDQVNAYISSVVRDIVTRYPVDGVHLDLVRYAGVGYSYDPSSDAAAGERPSDARAQWQRDQITALVQRITQETKSLRPQALVSAAVWPTYIDRWGWGVNEGYSDYYQDSKGWLASGSVDAIAPMLYGSYADDAERWEILLLDFMMEQAGQVLPGIGSHYSDFTDIAWRIDRARQAGASGHAIFSYRGLNASGHWNALRLGPYRIPARLP